MADKSYGVGLSFRWGPRGQESMVWITRETWAEVIADVTDIFGPENVFELNKALEAAWTASSDGSTDGTSTAGTTAPAPAAEPEQAQNFETCPRCQTPKSRWVPPGISSKTGRRYPGFFACETPGCPGK